MTGNIALPAALAGRSIVLVGLMGAGKSAIGRRLAARIGLPFRDADAEIEQAAGTPIADIFARYGEAAFRDGERRVIARLLAGPPAVLATGGGAFVDPATRALVRDRAISLWLRAPLDVLVRRTRHRHHRPLLAGGDPEEVLRALIAKRHPVYAEADIHLASGEENPEATVDRALAALAAWRPPARVPVAAAAGAYEVTIGRGVLARAGALLAPLLPRREAIVIVDDALPAQHRDALATGLADAAIDTRILPVAAGEAAKSLAGYTELVERVLDAGVERRTAIVALGGGVVGDLAGFVAATALRGLPFVQIPTTLLAQVDSSVGGKTGVNARAGKNLVGAFHQPVAVLADTAVLDTLPPRELRAGYAEIVKAGLIGDAAFFDWCLAHGPALVAGDSTAAAVAIARAVAFKAAVVAADPLEATGQRALLNLGHTFGHALEAAFGYTGALLHGEAVAVGLVLACRLSERLGVCAPGLAGQVAAHLEVVGLPASISALGQNVASEALLAAMRRDKKVADGRLAFVLLRGAGEAFLSRDVPEEAVLATIEEDGARSCGQAPALRN